MVALVVGVPPSLAGESEPLSPESLHPRKREKAKGIVMTLSKLYCILHSCIWKMLTQYCSLEVLFVLSKQGDTSAKIK